MSQELQGILDLQGGGQAEASSALSSVKTGHASPATAPSPQAESAPAAGHAGRLVLLWDLPTRLFHWSLVASVSTAIASGLAGGNWMVWHGRAGIAVSGLLAFRIVWGFVGGDYSRFKSFVPGLQQLRAYLGGRWQGLGHNPLGALSVLALLSLLLLQAITGLLGNDEIAFSGPLASLVDESQSLHLTGWHQQLANVLFAWIGLHLLAMVFHRLVKKDDLLRPMISGVKRTTALGEAVTPSATSPEKAGWLGLSVAVSTGLLTAYLASGAWLQEPAAGQTSSPATSSSSSTSSADPAPAAQPATTAPSSAPAW